MIIVYKILYKGIDAMAAGGNGTNETESICIRLYTYIYIYCAQHVEWKRQFRQLTRLSNFYQNPVAEKCNCAWWRRISARADDGTELNRSAVSPKVNKNVGTIDRYHYVRTWIYMYIYLYYGYYFDIGWMMLRAVNGLLGKCEEKKKIRVTA